MIRKAMTLVGSVAVASVLVAPQASATETRLSADRQESVQVAVVAPTGRTPNPLGGPGGFIYCPPGHHPVPFDQPIYDADGLFVIGYKTVWYCIPDDLEPAG